MPMLVIGLGNPGGEYARTRHNAGWDCLEELVRQGRFGRERREGQSRVREGSVDGFDVIVARPQTYMNLSGRAGFHLAKKFGVPPSDVVVVHDDIDLPLGRLRLRRGGSAGGQKGVASLIEAWRTADFIRVRIGIGRPEESDQVIDYVLERFRPDERDAIDAATRRAAEAIVAILKDGLEAAMTVFNQAPT